MHTLLDLHGNIPTYLNISDGKLHDVNILDDLPMEAGAFYIMDRAYLDFERLYRMNLCGSFFVLRAKKNTKLRRLRSNPVDRSTGLICDQIVKQNGLNSKERYPDQLRRIKFVDPESRKILIFLTNNLCRLPKQFLLYTSHDGKLNYSLNGLNDISESSRFWYF